MKDKHLIWICVSALAIAVVSVAWTSFSSPAAQPGMQKYVAVGWVMKYDEQKDNMGGLKYVNVMFEHANKQREMMSFCAQGSYPMLSIPAPSGGSTKITYSGIPGKGCYRLDKLEVIK